MLKVLIEDKSREEFLDILRKYGENEFLIKGGRAAIQVLQRDFNPELQVAPPSWPNPIRFPIETVGGIRIEYEKERDDAKGKESLRLGGFPINSYSFTVYIQNGEEWVEKDDYTLLKVKNL